MHGRAFSHQVLLANDQLVKLQRGAGARACVTVKFALPLDRGGISRQSVRNIIVGTAL